LTVARDAGDRIEWLREAVRTGAVHTVRASFADRLGHWRGKRIPATHFLEHLDQTVGFCDGMLVCDVRCDIIEETPYTNYGTGYPDADVRFDLERLRPVGWMPGEAYVFGDPHDHDGRPSQVSTRTVLRRVLHRLDALGVTAEVGFRVGGRFMHDPERPALIAAGGLGPGDDESGVLSRLGRGLHASEIVVDAIYGGLEAGAFQVSLGAGEGITAAEAAVVAKSAAKEIARQEGVTASFMTVQRMASVPALLEPTVELVIPGGKIPEPAAIHRRLTEIRSLTQPSVNAFKLGPPAVPLLDEEGSRVRISGLSASSEADPFTVTAAVLAAIVVDLGAGLDSHLPGDAADLGVAADQLAASPWAAEWLGPEFVANSLPLLRREANLIRSVVTDWEIDRYWATA
jgi:glutamine synthetase